jgi:transposase
MNSGQYVFAQITDFLPKWIFEDIVKRHKGNKNIRHFSCWNQLLVMLFGQLSSRESLRDVITVIEAHYNKRYHLGFGTHISRSNLAKANEKRTSKIFEEFAYHLIGVVRKKLINNDFEIKGKVYAFDSTTIDLCLSVFWWAKFRKQKGGIKLHTLFDITTQIPTFIHITNATVNDMNAMDVIPYETGAYYVFDRGYVDFSRLYKITEIDSFFVIRAKINLQFQVIKNLSVNEKNGVLSDTIITLSGFYQKRNYPNILRKVVFYDSGQNRTFVFLTNNFELSAEQIAFLYKNRWQIELFFKWIKQHLKIKSFWGTSENAVRIQIYTAIIAYCLVAIMAHDLKIERSTYEILQILTVSLLDKTPVNQLFNQSEYQNVKEPNYNVLILN